MALYKCRCIYPYFHDRYKSKCKSDDSWSIKELSETSLKMSKIPDRCASKESLVPVSSIRCSVVFIVSIMSDVD